jgi:glycosyltransferase involved in cell wall biosynthesis
MLVSHGHEVHLFVDERYKDPPPLTGTRYEGTYEFHATTPPTDLVDYQSRKELSESHKLYSTQLSEFYVSALKDLDIVLTHDFILTGWNLPYGIAIKKATPSLPKVRWLNWIHSIPTASRDWWNIREYGTRHRIVFPNRADSDIVANQFHGKESDIRVIPHIKDIRSLMEFEDLTCKFIEDHPAIFDADIVKVYPASTDRLGPKGVDKITLIMAQIERRKFKTFTVIANQHANKRTRREDVQRYEQVAKRNGLDPNRNFIFTSTWDPELELGVPQKTVMELMMCSNLFVYPTREESFGLIGPEAMLAGGCIMMLNQSLPMMMEVHGGQGIYSEFGSFRNGWKSPDEGAYYRQLADSLLGQYRQNIAAQHKTFIRRRYNWDYIYHRDYAPVFAESELWL